MELDGLLAEEIEFRAAALHQGREYSEEAAAKLVRRLARGGWVIVPRVATRRMLDVLFDHLWNESWVGNWQESAREEALEAWQAMLDEASGVSQE